MVSTVASERGGPGFDMTDTNLHVELACSTLEKLLIGLPVSVGDCPLYVGHRATKHRPTIACNLFICLNFV